MNEEGAKASLQKRMGEGWREKSIAAPHTWNEKRAAVDRHRPQTESIWPGARVLDELNRAWTRSSGAFLEDTARAASEPGGQSPISVLRPAGPAWAKTPLGKSNRAPPGRFPEQSRSGGDYTTRRRDTAGIGATLISAHACTAKFISGDAASRRTDQHGVMLDEERQDRCRGHFTEIGQCAARRC